MEKPNYSNMMNAQEIKRITPDWNEPIAKGTLIGFTWSDGKKVMAAYPVWRVIPEKKEIQFVLYTSLEGSPCIDNTWFTSDGLCINVDPIIVEIDEKKPHSITDRMSQIFNG